MATRYLTWIDGAQVAVTLLEVSDDVVLARLEDVGEDGEPIGEPRELRLDVGTFLRPPRGGKGAGEWQIGLEDGRQLSGFLLDEVPGTRDGELVVTTGLVKTPVLALSERDAWLGGGAMDDDAGHVTVAMPGLVVKLLVGMGDAVESGQPVVIVEAMKMENEVKAGRSGVVTGIHVAAGDSVEAGATLLDIGDPEG